MTQFNIIQNGSYIHYDSFLFLFIFNENIEKYIAVNTLLMTIKINQNIIK